MVVAGKLYVSELQLNGVGYKSFFSRADRAVFLQLGYSHYLRLRVADDILDVKTKRQRIVVIGRCPIGLGNLTRKLIDLKRPDPYKAAGVRVRHRQYTLREGKKR